MLASLIGDHRVLDSLESTRCSGELGPLALEITGLELFLELQREFRAGRHPTTCSQVFGEFKGSRLNRDDPIVPFPCQEQPVVVQDHQQRFLSLIACDHSVDRGGGIAGIGADHPTVAQPLGVQSFLDSSNAGVGANAGGQGLEHHCGVSFLEGLKQFVCSGHRGRCTEVRVRELLGCSRALDAFESTQRSCEGKNQQSSGQLHGSWIVSLLSLPEL